MEMVVYRWCSLEMVVGGGPKTRDNFLVDMSIMEVHGIEDGRMRG